MRLILIAAGLLLAGIVNAALHEVQTARPIAPGVTETVWELKVDAGEFDRVALHEYRGEAPPVARLFYLPGTNMHAASGVADENHNLLLYLARRGILVQAMDYRNHFVPHDTDADLRFMLGWTMQAYIDDAERLATARPASLPLIITGFSRGAGYAYALAGRVEAAGLIALDGSFKNPTGNPVDREAELAKLVRRERYASVLSRRGFEGRHAMMLAARDHPAGPATDERYATAGEQLATTLHKAWGPGVLANTADGLTPVPVLAAQMIDYDWYFPRVQDIDARAIASVSDDPLTALDDHWGDMQLPVYYVGSGNFPSAYLMAGVYSAAASGSRDVTLRILDNYGHTDVLTATSAPADVFAPVLEWIRQHIDD